MQALLDSIDRSEPFGLRDFTPLYLAATYGLRSGELVRLTLDDLDWRGRTLRVAQTKTKQAIRLPLTDEAANLLVDYLRKARPESRHRQLFLRMRAPNGPLKPASVHDVLDHRRLLSGLNLPEFGTHVLRHYLPFRTMSGTGTQAQYLRQMPEVVHDIVLTPSISPMQGKGVHREVYYRLPSSSFASAGRSSRVPYQSVREVTE